MMCFEMSSTKLHSWLHVMSRRASIPGSTALNIVPVGLVHIHVDMQEHKEGGGQPLQYQ